MLPHKSVVSGGNSIQSQTANTAAVVEDVAHRDDGMAGAEAPQPPTKKVKRGQYVSKACAHCHSRKIKCDGNMPCRQCVAKERDCHWRHVRSRPKMPPRDPSGPGAKETEASQDQLLRRITYLEAGLQRLVESNSARPDATPTKLDNGERHNVLVVDTPPDGMSPFVGETSMDHTLREVESRFQKICDIDQAHISAPTSQSSNSSNEPAVNAGQSHGNYLIRIHDVLEAHDIAADSIKWAQYLEAFLDEMHVLYPVLHPPTLRENYRHFCNQVFHKREENDLGDLQIQAAQILICLAIGRCTSATRAGSELAQHSSGWSLYSAAVDMVGGEEGLFNLKGCSLVSLQTLTLMVVYLLRLDAAERTSKFIAILISHAHQLGLHRDKVLSPMPVFEREMYRRLWWCIYMLDRRVSLETGLPFVIQDMNVDTGFPSNVSDEWLWRSRDSYQTSDTLKAEIGAELSVRQVTPIPYLTCMIRYSKVIGKVWEALYRARQGHPADPSFEVLAQEYLEHLISSAERQTPPDLVYDIEKSSAEQTSGLEWWQAKQKALLHMRWTFLRICIRRPMINREPFPESMSNMENIQNELNCMRLAMSIFDQFQAMYSHRPTFEFPFPLYLTRTTMISLGLIIKEPSFRQTYGSQILQMSRIIKRLCRQTWVSGKFARSVVTLNKMAESVLGRSASSVTEPDMQSSTNLNPVQMLPDGPNTVLYGDDGETSERTSPSNTHDTRLSHVDGAAIMSEPQYSFSHGGANNMTANSQVYEREGTDATAPQVRITPSAAPSAASSAASNAPFEPLSTVGHEARDDEQLSSSSLLDSVMQDFDFEQGFISGSAHRQTYFSHLSTNSYTQPSPLYQTALGVQHMTQGSMSGMQIGDNPTDTVGRAADPQLDPFPASMDWIQDLLGAGLYVDPFNLW